MFSPSIFERGGLVIGLVLFFTMLFVPTAYQPLKAILLAVLLSAISIGLLRRQIDFKLHQSVIIWSVTIILCGAFFIMVGVINGAPGALRVGTVYLLWPLVFTILIGAITRRIIHQLLAVLILASIALGMYGAMFFAHELGWLPSALYVKLDQGQAIGLYDGYVEYNMYSIASLIYLIPFLIALILHCRNVCSTVILPRWVIWCAYALLLALAILSGRRVLWLMLVLAPAIYWAVTLFSPFVQGSQSRRVRLAAFAQLLMVSVGVFMFLKLVFGLELSAMTRYTVASFGVSEQATGVPEPSASLRHVQARALISGWLESPWIGHGHGAVAPGVIRDVKMPWAYELSYLALLFHTGLLGALIYAGCIGWIYLQALRMIRASDDYELLMVPVLVGTTSFLIANATNPYLEKFDYMWVLFLPLAIINRFLIERDAQEV